MRYLSLALAGLFIILNHGSLAQDILFPGERPSLAQRVNKLTSTSTTSRTTTPEPAIKCPANMTLTKEPGETKEYCECLMGNLYYTKLDRCFHQYTRGPCKEGEHFVLLPNTTIAKCVSNPCKQKDTVLYKGSCYQLYVSGGPCAADKTLTIPDTSHAPECVDILAVNYQFINAPPRPCAPGTRRTAQGKCREVIR